MCFTFAGVVPIGVCSTLKTGGWEEMGGEACCNPRHSGREVSRAVTGSPEEDLQGEEGLGTVAAHSSVLAWRIPWTEEPGGLQSMGCKESDTTETI